MSEGETAIRAVLFLASVIGLTFVLQTLSDFETVAEASSEGPIEQSSTQAREPADAARRSTIEQKDELERTVRQELDAIQAEMRTWQEKTDAMSESARAELERAIKRLEMRKDLARRKLEDLRRTTSATWARWQESMVQTLDELKRAYREAVAALP